MSAKNFKILRKRAREYNLPYKLVKKFFKNAPAEAKRRFLEGKNE